MGRDPGVVEEREGKPFCGPSGELLEGFLDIAKLARPQVLVANVVGERPPANKWEAHSEEAKERGAKACAALLKRKPRKLIVALGEQALHTALGLHPDDGRYESTEVRGYIFEGPYGPVLAALHPAFTLRQWHPNFELTRRDFVKGRKWLGGERGSGDRTTGFPTSLAEAQAEVQASKGAARTAIDIETRADGAIACVGFATSERRGYTLPYAGRYVGLVEELVTREGLVFHNGQFDVTVLRRNGHKVRDGFDDTMLMWHSLEPTLAGQRDSKKGKKRSEKSLRFLAGLLTWEPFWKDYEFKSEEERWRLCAKDSRVTWEVAESLLRMLAGGPRPWEELR